jgi:hypothetical protein
VGSAIKVVGNATPPQCAKHVKVLILILFIFHGFGFAGKNTQNSHFCASMYIVEITAVNILNDC